MWPLALVLVVLPQDTVRRERPADTLETLIVRATRGGAAAPTSQSTIDRSTISKTHVGQDVPLALGRLPGITATSDAGGYSGYSSLRIRGVDQTRVTISVDGVPLNDPEDQVLYFSNVPDFLASMQSVRVQRGVGSSGFGTASFGGSLNFESVAIAASPRFSTTEATVGSFGTRRASTETATGLRGSWAGYGRVTGHTTDGYRHHSGNDAWSAFGSFGWFGGRDALKVTGFAGRSKTQLAYVAASEAELAIDRRANPLSPAEKDDFHQEMVSVRYSRSLSQRTLLTATAYRNSAGGNYDVAVGDELWNFGLNHAWYGLFATTTWTGDRASVTAGMHASRYHRDHSLAVRPDLASLLYDNTGYKQEQSGFFKATVGGRTVDLHGDLEIRRAAFQYRPTAGATFGRPAADWWFVNPKVGLTWRPSDRWLGHLSIGRTSREPARADLFAGADDLDETLAAELLPLDRVRPETVTDLEAGLRWAGPTRELALNAFTMRFRNEIAPIGTITFIGTPLRRNVPRSHRSGVELEGTWRPATRFSLAGNATVMRARIAEYTDEASGVTHRDVAPLLTPWLIGNLTGRLDLSRAVSAELGLRHVARSQLANDDSPTQLLPAATTADAAIRLAIDRLEIRAQVANLFGADAYASGYTDGTTRYLFPIARRAFLLSTAITLGHR